ncbi:hypothetical protein FB45DRAFT_865818 [Roridomyces roridus]|uniref:AMP-dependent synthetase/ligase domain-containing protein n=1 Tax=Roridomyces roridus TaxID=1738132 RepID=A0AAD7C056_9AGAR|nr:hypothetical protein FB45DRAFT_865818 [Roridomyces roridus]
MDHTLELNHLALLQDRARNAGDNTLFKLGNPEMAHEWVDVTVAEFAAEVDRMACILLTHFRSKGIPSRSVIGMLMHGRPYIHLVYTIAISRAGYVPQMIPMAVLEHGIISELMQKADAKAIVIDSESSAPASVTNYRLPLVPITQRFIRMKSSAEFDTLLHDKKFETQDVFLQRGNLNSISFMRLYPATHPPTKQELFTLVNTCGLNRIATYGTYLSATDQFDGRGAAIFVFLGIKNGGRKVSTWKMARLFSVGMRFRGVAISNTDDDWCFQNGIGLVDIYAMTECGIIMTTVPGKPSRYIRPLPTSTISCRFDPVLYTDDPSPQLFQFILLADSLKLPQPHLLSADGNFHSEDLFERMSDDSYVFHGRNDDWIKTKIGRPCDVGSIEQKVLETCGDLVKQCIAVGSLRPSPALFVELHSSLTVSNDKVKEMILTHLHEFNIRRYTLEGITDERLLFVVEQAQR